MSSLARKFDAEVEKLTGECAAIDTNNVPKPAATSGPSSSSSAAASVPQLYHQRHHYHRQSTKVSEPSVRTKLLPTSNGFPRGSSDEENHRPERDRARSGGPASLPPTLDTPQMSQQQLQQLLAFLSQNQAKAATTTQPTQKHPLGSRNAPRRE